MRCLFCWLFGKSQLRTEPSPAMAEELDTLKTRMVETSIAADAATTNLKDTALRNLLQSGDLKADIQRSVGDVVKSMQHREKRRS